jgi:F-type H+-transporting ATPase subunit alpha
MVAGKTKLELAQYREIADFTQFSSDIDESTRKILARGQRVTKLLMQPANEPVDLRTQIMLMSLAASGELDDIPLDKFDDVEAYIFGSMVLTAAEDIHLLFGDLLTPDVFEEVFEEANEYQELFILDNKEPEHVYEDIN